MNKLRNIFYVLFLTVFAFSNEAVNNYMADNDEKPLVSIHAEDTHLPSILAILASESGYNIVTGPNVQTQNKLTIHLDDVPIDQAINLVIRAAWFSYEIVGKSILVANQSKINEDVGVTPHVIALQYANAEEVAELLKNVTENITIDPTGNKLLVTASPKKLLRLFQLLKKLIHLQFKSCLKLV